MKTLVDGVYVVHDRDTLHFAEGNVDKIERENESENEDEFDESCLSKSNELDSDVESELIFFPRV